MSSCCFTGHRPQSLPFKFNESDIRCLKLKKDLSSVIKRVIEEQDVRHFITGMALGVDTYAAEIVLKLKRKYKDIILEAAVPCENQDLKWFAKDRERYKTILEQCDKVTILQKNYTFDCMHKRNQYMIDNSDIVIAVWNGSPSGTGKTVAYAQEREKKIVIINPEKLIKNIDFLPDV